MGAGSKGERTAKRNESRDEEKRIVGLDLSRFEEKESGGGMQRSRVRIQDQGVVKVITVDLVTSRAWPSRKIVLVAKKKAE